MAHPERSIRTWPAYAAAAGGGALATAGLVRALLAPRDPSPAAVFMAAASCVVVVLAATAGRLGRLPPVRSLAAAPVLGLLLAAGAHLALVLPLAIVYPPAQDLVDVIVGRPGGDELDARLIVVLLVTAGVLAPLTEEPAKAVSGGFARAGSRSAAFLAGATAGAGFSIVEHAFYSLPVAGYGETWVQVLLLRSASAAMHPLASGLVFLGWWEARRAGTKAPLIRGLLLGIGIHAVWNVTAVVAEGFATASRAGAFPRSVEAAALTYAGAIAILIAVAMWRTVTSLRAGSAPERPSGRAWAALVAGLAGPLALLPVVLPRL